MAYGTVKTKALIYESGGSDVTFDYTTLIENGDNYSGNTVQGQIISGATGIFSTSISGSEVNTSTLTVTTFSGISGIFTSLLSGATITGTNVNTTNITGQSVSGTDIQFTSGIAEEFISTGTISGSIITGQTGFIDSLQAASGVFESEVSGILFKASGNVIVISGSGDVKAYGLLSFPPFVGASGQFLTSNGDGSTNWETDVYSVEIVSGTVTGEPGKTYVIVSGTTLTLPATPATGEFLSVINRSNTVTGVIARNGESIMGVAENLTIDDVNFSADFIYYGSSEGWVFI